MDMVLNSLTMVVYYALDFYKWIVIVNVVASWLVAFNVINTSNQVVYMVMDFTYRLTEPLYRRIRAVMPNLGGIDLSPIVVLLGVFFFQSLVVQMAQRL
ncbi:YggT family protein [Pseudomonadota bacterium]